MQDERGKVLKRKLSAERSKNWRLRKKTLKVASEQKEDNTQQPLDNVEATSKSHLPPETVTIVLSQIRVSKLPKQTRRWTYQDKSFALSIYHASKKAYSLLQKVFHLPSPRTLSLAMQNIHIGPGVCENILRLFKIKVTAMIAQEKVCAILFDVMAIKSSTK